jgi:hypothetical protein
MGEIDQPENLFLNLADRVKRGEVKLPPGFKYDDVESIMDDFSKRSTVLARSLVINEVFITRLGCEATRKKVKTKHGSRIDVTRKPRSARFDVLHHRRESEGLHLVDEDGERIPLLLPHRLAAPDLKANLAPSLFLSLPDPMREFKKWMGGTVNIINADKSLTHISKFVHFDQRSDTDLGGWARSGSRSPRSSSSPASATTALSEIARVVPSGWYWNGKGFYDNHVPSGAKYGGYGKHHDEGYGAFRNSKRSTHTISFDEFEDRAKVAAEENAEMQTATKDSPNVLRRDRDHENCFRIAELGIPAGSDVVVLGAPQIATESWLDEMLLLHDDDDEAALMHAKEKKKKRLDGALVIGPPPTVTAVAQPRFLFRILKGFAIDTLITHREGSMLVYLGFAAMGVMTVGSGEEMIRDQMCVEYM